MKKSIISIYLLGIILSANRAVQAQNYTTPVFDYRVEKNIVYGVDTNYAGCPISLYMDIYKPLANSDTCRPLLVLVHGGAFVVGTKEDGNMVSLAQEMAARGYVVASINYRLGWHTQVTVNTIACDALGYPVSHCTYAQDTSETIRAAYRGMQDAKGAIRFLKSRHLTDSTSLNHTIIAGHSAGAIISLLVGYADRESEKPIDAGIWTDALNSPNTNCYVCDPIKLARPDLGSVEGTLHVNNGYDAKVEAVIAFAGALLNLNMLYNDNNYYPKLMLYHQSCDHIAPFQNGRFFGSINSCFSCLGCSQVVSPTAYGGRAIADYIQANNLPMNAPDSHYYDLRSIGNPISCYYGLWGPDAVTCIQQQGTLNCPYCANANWQHCHDMDNSSGSPTSFQNIAEVLAQGLSLRSCNTSAVFDPAQETAFQISPNPFADNISIRLNSAEETAFEVRLTDLTGRCVIHLLSQSRILDISTQKLAAGVYLLHIQMDGQQWIRKLIK